MERLGKYYTQSLFSDLLVSNITFDNPKRILELGAGDGSLLKAASVRWLNANFIATDIDKTSVKKIEDSLPFVNIFHVNSLKRNLDQKLKINVGSIDVALCNPPYLKVKPDKSFAQLFKMAHLDNCQTLPILTSDIIFLAQNLSLLKKNGELGIILPDSIMTGHEFLKLRKDLLENHKVTKVIQLPEKIFSKTEALTHILFIEKGSSTNSSIDIYSSNKTGVCDKHLVINSQLLIERMDFKYHSYFSKRTVKTNIKTLAEISTKIQRGTIQNKSLRALNIPQVHTTSLLHGQRNLFFRKRLPQKYSLKYLTAGPGDILLARVGRGCVGKTSMIGNGNAIISDCIYKIQVPEKYRTLVFNSFTSPEGQNWLKAMSHGVCAKVLSKTDLLQFPLDLSE
jgi:type I restriction enzyme M protein